jgi:hypothetical protein
VSKPFNKSTETVADLQRRASEALAIAGDQSLLSWQRTLKAIQAFSGTQLTGLPPMLHQAIEKHFVAVNRILDNYHLEKDEDYSRMSEADLRRIRNIVKALVSKIVPSN